MTSIVFLSSYLMGGLVAAFMVFLEIKFEGTSTCQIAQKISESRGWNLKFVYFVFLFIALTMWPLIAAAAYVKVQDTLKARAEYARIEETRAVQRPPPEIIDYSALVLGVDYEPYFAEIGELCERLQHGEEVPREDVRAALLGTITLARTLQVIAVDSKKPPV